MNAPARLNQIAFSVVDLRRTEAWFRTAFGLLPAGGTRSFRGPLASHVQGSPRAASTCWWLVGRDDYLQLEFFQFESPLAKLLPVDHRPSDIGYARVGIWVQDFDATLTRFATLDSRPLTVPMGEHGRRRACVRSPDGVYVEIMEDDPLAARADRTEVARPECPAAPRYVTLTVPDLEQSLRFFAGALRLPSSKVALHTPEHEALWGQAGARCRVVAAATAWRLSNSSQGERRAELFEAVLRHTPESKVRRGLAIAAGTPPTVPAGAVAQALGNGSLVTAPDTVPFAIWCAASHLNDYAGALIATVSCGGDCDTNAAIVGGITTLYMGRHSIPAEWRMAREALPFPHLNESR